MPVPTPFVVSPYDTNDNDIRSHITKLPNGNVVVVYEHSLSTNRQLAMRVFTAEGVPVTDEVLFGTARHFPKVVAIDNNTFAVVLCDFANGTALLAKTFTLAGSTITNNATFTLSDAGAGEDNGNGHEVVRLQDGKFLVVWGQLTGDFANAQITARTFDANWNPLTPETRISEFNNNGVTGLHVTMNGTTAIVTWSQNDPTTGGSIHGRMASFTVGGDGSLPASPPNDIDLGDNTGVQYVLKLANGDILVLFNGGPVSGGALDDGDKLNGRIYSADLGTVKANFLVNPTVDDNGTTTVSAVAFAGGGFMVVWGQDPAGGTNPSTDLELFTRVYDRNYAPTGLPVQQTDDLVNDRAPVATVDAAGNVTIVWETTNVGNRGSQVGIYLANQDPNASLPPGPVADTDAVIQRLTESGNVLANDTDPDSASNTLRVSLVRAGVGADVPVVGAVPTVINGAYGRLTLNADGSYSYLANVEGLTVGQTYDDVFTYTVSDPDGNSATQTLTVTVTGSATGDAGANTINGTAGADTLVGLDGADILNGAGDDDSLTGGAGDDILDGGSGEDVMTGGAGNDVYVVDEVDDGIVEAAGDAADEVRTTMSTFTLGVTAGSLNVENLTGLSTDGQILIGNAGDNVITGFTGDDTLVGGMGADVLNGGGGVDFADYGVSSGAVTVNLATGSGTGGEAQGDTLNSIEDLRGSDFNDVLTGDGVANNLFGGAGDDVLDGGAGDDHLVGGLGVDSLTGGDGADTIEFGAEDSLVSGGSGYDVGYVTSGTRTVINLETASIEYIVDEAGGNDWFQGTTRTEAITVFAGAGNDVAQGGSASDILWGEAGDDTLVGNAGNDVLVGGAGADLLAGGLGRDELYGGAADGAQDVFRFTASGIGAPNWDWVSQFEVGVDKIDLRSLTADFNAVTINVVGGNSQVFLSGQQVCTVIGVTTLTVADFLLASPPMPDLSAVKYDQPLVRPFEGDDGAVMVEAPEPVLTDGKRFGAGHETVLVAPWSVDWVW